MPLVRGHKVVSGVRSDQGVSVFMFSDLPSAPALWSSGYQEQASQDWFM